MVKDAGFVSARADVPSDNQTFETIYTLGAYNAPTTMSLFRRYFPPHEI